MSGVIEVEDPDDPRLAEYRHLNDQAKRREMEGDEFFLSEGWMSIERIIDSGHRIRSALLSPSRANRFRPFLDRAALAGVSVFVADSDVMHELVGFHLPRAVLVSADRHPLIAVGHLARTARRLTVLEALNDSVNIGAIARAARAFEIDAMVLSPTCVDPYYRRTVRVSMGEILHLPVARATASEWPEALDTLHDAGFETWAMTPADDADDIWSVDVPDRVAIVLGAEGPGLTDAAIERATRRVRIPISGSVDSLNVGHAAAIAFASISR